MKKYRCYHTSVEDFLTAPQQAGIAPERYFSMVNDAFIKDNGVEYSFSIDHDINLMELAFVNSGRSYVFIDNEDAEYLYRMKFSGTMMDSLPLHRSVFAISPTTNLQIDGVPILPIMVCDYESRTKSTKQIADAFNQPVLGAPVNEEQLLFTIVIPDSMAKHNQKLTLGVSGAQLKEIAGTNDPERIHDVVGHYGAALTLTADEKKRLAVSLKLVVSMSLFNHITEGEYLRDGFPVGLAKKPKHLGLMKHELKGSRTTVFKLGGEHNTSSRGQHIRSAHYRQLVDERYYRNEHQDKPIGSRWVPVKASIVGGGSAETQTTPT